ncbi:hypothetical protein OSB04_011872 [Centaurea solstitialis]|uniref:Uncharacterized protein n=1 Tax=Centaurea solstitialis TaxID=347529 RepID=A0AA38TV16_9ASTR|nr:hypothetical protein OSB04_011872 [Centaurea solstitialis]
MCSKTHKSRMPENFPSNGKDLTKLPKSLETVHIDLRLWMVRKSHKAGMQSILKVEEASRVTSDPTTSAGTSSIALVAGSDPEAASLAVSSLITATSGPLASSSLSSSASFRSSTSKRLSDPNNSRKEANSPSAVSTET